MNMINDGGPAFPLPCDDHRDFHAVFESGYGGMTLRQYAAISLRVPQSGEEWLDKMISEARRLDAAEKAMQGLAAIPEAWDMTDEKVAEWAYNAADAMLKAREVSNDKQ